MFQSLPRNNWRGHFWELGCCLSAEREVVHPACHLWLWDFLSYKQHGIPSNPVTFPSLSFLSLPPLCHSSGASEVSITLLGFHNSQHLQWHPSQIKQIEVDNHRDIFLVLNVVCSPECWHSGNPNANVITSVSDAFPHFPCRLPPSLSVQPKTEGGSQLRPMQI